jgi:acetolactate synthase-1/2/3 large subunit
MKLPFSKSRLTKSSMVESHSRTGGEWFVKILQANGVEYVFGTTGGGMPDIQDAMTVVKPPIWIQCLHEFPTVAAGMGYALASEKTAVCLIDRMVGTTNALGALYAAYENYAPLAVFASQNLPASNISHVKHGKPRMDVVHHHSWQSIFTTPWTKWRYELSNLELLPSSIDKALLTAGTEPTGPTYMTLRQDLMAQRLRSAPILPMRETSLSKMTADQESIKEGAKLLAEAENPIIFATHAGRHASAVPRLVELAETLGCGVLDGRAFLNFPMDHPLFLGFLSYWQASPFIEEADVLLNVENYYEPPTSPPGNCRVIDIYPDPAMLQGGAGGDYGGTLYPSSLRLVGDTTTILTQLTSTVRKMLPKRGSKSSVEERFEKNKAAHERVLSAWVEEARRHLKDDPVSAHRIAYELNELWDDKTVWVDTTLTMRSILTKGIHLNKPGTQFTNPSGHLGVAAGEAYGVALARPSEKVIATTGDGEFIFGNPPAVLWTCSHYHIPVLYIIFNNACWGIEWKFIEETTLGLAAKHRDYEFVDVDEPRINFGRIAEAFGVHAETIDHPDETTEKLRRGMEMVSRGEPALIDVHLPKHTEGQSSYRYTFRRPGNRLV